MEVKLKDNELQGKNDLELSPCLDDVLDKLEGEGYGVWPYNDSNRGLGFTVYSAKKKITNDNEVYYFLRVDLARSTIYVYKTFNPNVLDGKEVNSIGYPRGMENTPMFYNLIHNIIDKFVPSNTVIDYKESLDEGLTTNAFNPEGKETTYGRFKIINNGGVYTLVNRKGNALKISNARSFDDVKKEIDNELSKGAIFVPKFYYEDLDETLSDEEMSLLDKVDAFIIRLYKLRQDSIKEEGEFGVGNLLFKEFRNLGYLDTLKKLKVKLQSKDMCLEDIKEALLLEKGTDYKKQASKIISNSGLFDEETSTKIIDGLFRQDIHAFNHAPAWLEKYLKGIARMLVEYCNGDKSKAEGFLTECPGVFEQYLTWVKENREKVGTQLDDEFVNKLSYKEVKDKVEELQQELEKKSKDELSKMKFTNKSDYTLVPIDSLCSCS